MPSVDDLKKIAKCLRALSIDQVEIAKSGHPGLPLGCADIVATVYSEFLLYDPDDPSWVYRDRFVLSAGHGSALLYAALALFMNHLPVEELKTFRQVGSRLAGHPENHLLPGVEATTGPLGQGVANAVGLALSAKMLKARHAQSREFKVFCLCSDGDLMEGISYEACSIAGFLGLDNLILMYDDNKVSLAGPTSVCFREDVRRRFESQGWLVFEANGLEVNSIFNTLKEAVSSEVNQPRLVMFRTEIGYGSPKANTHEVHGSPLGEKDALITKQNLGLHTESFTVPEDVLRVLESIKIEKKNRVEDEKKRLQEVAQNCEFSLEEFLTYASNLYPSGVVKEATRNTGEKFLQFAAQKNSFVVGGSADLEPSTKAYLKGERDLTREDFAGRNIRFGVREHAMAGICNGLALSGFFKPFCSTFLCFLDYLKPSLRLSALSHLPVLYVLTHDTVLLGEDGPTHQPIEHLTHLRSIPNFVTFRPSNLQETAFSYWWWLSSQNTPCAIILSRQSFTQISPAKINLEDLHAGFSVIIEGEKPTVTVLASGSEVALAYEAISSLKRSDIRLVSVNSFELLRNAISNNDQLVDRLFGTDRIVFCELSSVASTADLFISRVSCIKKLSLYTLGRFGVSGKDQDVARALNFSVESFADFLTRL